jgi:hypothetical protein
MLSLYLALLSLSESAHSPPCKHTASPLLDNYRSLSLFSKLFPLLPLELTLDIYYPRHGLSLRVVACSFLDRWVKVEHVLSVNLIQDTPRLRKWLLLSRDDVGVRK